MSKTWSVSGLITAAMLLVWAGAFWYIIATDRVGYYLASRTAWLAPVGAVTLTLAGLGRLVSARAPHREPVSKRQLVNLIVVAVPALALVLMPPITLGSYAAERRDVSLKGAYVGGSSRDLSQGDLSLMDVFSLSYNGDLDRLGSRAGSTSSFTGFVSRDPGAPADEFTLNRFMISCCPGDAVNVQVRIVGAPPGEFKSDEWVRVTGGIYPVGEQLVVDASEVVTVSRPKRPYLNPSR